MFSIRIGVEKSSCGDLPVFGIVGICGINLCSLLFLYVTDSCYWYMNVNSNIWEVTVQCAPTDAEYLHFSTL